MDIIAYACHLGTGLQIIELVDTGHNSGLGGGRIASAGISSYLRSIAAAEEVVTSGTGQGKRVFTVPASPGAVTIEVIDGSLGRHHSGQCKTCPARARCIEGFWALRLDSAGTLAPCLLRTDLRLDVTRHSGDPAALLAAVSAHLDAFTEGTLG
jgi:cyclic pyranopterin phosphate synthase